MFHRGAGRNDALRGLPDERRNIVLMDIDPEQESCLDLCRDMRRVSEVPTFVFAARKCDRHMVNALDAGTDDNIVKPRALEDILARIRAVLLAAIEARSLRLRAVLADSRSKAELSPS